MFPHPKRRDPKKNIWLQGLGGRKTLSLHTPVYVGCCGREGYSRIQNDFYSHISICTGTSEPGWCSPKVD